jgi:hypothetical protein
MRRGWGFGQDSPLVVQVIPALAAASPPGPAAFHRLAPLVIFQPTFFAGVPAPECLPSVLRNPDHRRRLATFRAIHRLGIDTPAAALANRVADDQEAADGQRQENEAGERDDDELGEGVVVHGAIRKFIYSLGGCQPALIQFRLG